MTSASTCRLPSRYAEDEASSSSSSSFNFDDETTSSRSGTSRTAAMTVSTQRAGSLRSNKLKDGENDEEEDQVLTTRQENNKVSRWRKIVFLALAASAVVVGLGTYFFAAGQETLAFETDFVAVSHALADSAEMKAHRLFGQAHSMSTSMTLHVNDAKMMWPFCTIPYFDPQSSKNMRTSGSIAELAILTPIVSRSTKRLWEDYAWHNQGWVTQDLALRGQESFGNIPKTIYPWSSPSDDSAGANHPSIHRRQSQVHQSLEDDTGDSSVPVWQIGPVPTTPSLVNLDLNTHTAFQRLFQDARVAGHSILSEILDLDFLFQGQRSLLSEDVNDPRSVVVEPVLASHPRIGSKETPVVGGFLIQVLSWKRFFRDLATEKRSSKGGAVLVDMYDGCGSNFTLLLNGTEVCFAKEGFLLEQLRHTALDHLKETFQFAREARFHDEENATPVHHDEVQHCEYTMTVTPTTSFEAPYHTDSPGSLSLVFVMPFVLCMLVFALLDFVVQRRQDKVLQTATRTTAILGSLFPENVKKRLLHEAQQQAAKTQKKPTLFPPRQHGRGDALLRDENATSQLSPRGTPIAELFSACTIMYADLVGFTAWSSIREPEQVFVLLETIYHAFDEIARARRVFKVETVGDCYVAVCGLPNPRKDHATVMARFANGCLIRLQVLLKNLEVSLGPETSDLSMRFGLHSGPVTAGVLRSKNSRFQLFGETVNRTALIEATGETNKIHISSETARFLSDAGKGHWIAPRSELVIADGNELETYWLTMKQKSHNSSSSATGSSTEACDSDRDNHEGAAEVVDEADGDLQATNAPGARFSDKENRLVDWAVEVMTRAIEDVHRARKQSGGKQDPELTLRQLEEEYTVAVDSALLTDPVQDAAEFVSSRLRVEESIGGPRVGQNEGGDADDYQLDDAVTGQLRAFVQSIASIYQEMADPYENLEHVSHVIMSLLKLQSRVGGGSQGGRKLSLSDSIQGGFDRRTYGITEPLAKFASIFAAFVSGVRHSNDDSESAVAERPSLVAWSLFMAPTFVQLRRAIYSTRNDFQVFRQIVVNLVAAGDVQDKKSIVRRDQRWHAAFAQRADPQEVVVNLRATVIMEHLFQAAVVGHAIQHWLVYRKWSTCLFRKHCKAFAEGDLERNPRDSWFESELVFFDEIVIPLAQKLKECQIFGASSEEYLSSARRNREEWASTGESLVKKMLLESVNTR